MLETTINIHRNNRIAALLSYDFLYPYSTRIIQIVRVFTWDACPGRL